MTKKRFVPIFDGFDKRVVGAKDNGVIISFMDMFDLLNELHEENQFLNKQLNIYRDASKVDAREIKELLEDIDELSEENQHLRQISDLGKTDAKGVVNVLNVQQENIRTILKENNELKHENVNIMEDLDYFRTKNGSLEEGLFKQDKKIAKLEKENKELKKELDSFNPVVFNDMVKGTVILYNKGDDVNV